MNLVNFIRSYIKDNKLLILLFAVFFLIRLPLLDHAFLLRGERDITLTGWSLAKTGHDLYGNLLPLQFMGLDMPTPLLAFYYAALWWLVIPIKSVFTARLPFVVSSSFNLILIYELIKIITKNKRLAIITAAVFCFSPGIYHLSRLALEVNLATPLLLLATVLYLKQKRLIAWLFFFLTFFAYNGFRPLIPFLVVYLELFYFIRTHNRDEISQSVRIPFLARNGISQPKLLEMTKKFIKNSLTGVVIFLVLFGISYQFIDGRMMRQRANDLIFLSYDDINPKVDYRRNTAIGPVILKQVFNNKITNTGYYILEVFFSGQSLDYLFLKGDKAAIYTSTFAGQFFVIGLLFYYLGFLMLGKLWKKQYFYIIGFIPIALIPSLVNIDYVSIAIRSILASVSYAFIIGLGILLFSELFKNKSKYLMLSCYCVILLILSVELVYFGYNYFFRRPVTMFESFFESEKQIAQYLLITKNKVILYDDSPKNIVTALYLLNDDTDPNDIQTQLKKGSPYKVNNIIIKSCPTSDKKSQMFAKNIIVADSCLDEILYDKLNNQPKVIKIPFKDFSFKTAYFIQQ